MQIIQGKTRRQRVMERVLWDVLRDLLRDLLRERAEDGLLRASILDFKPKLANRCKIFPVYPIFRASILDFRARLGNRCRDFPVYPLLRASILDFKPRLANRCKLFPVYTILRASILDFRPRFANHCSTIVAAVWNGPPATAVAATNSASDSNLRCSEEEWFRLQRPWRQRSSASDSNHIAAKKGGLEGNAPPFDKGQEALRPHGFRQTFMSAGNDKSPVA